MENKFNMKNLILVAVAALIGFVCFNAGRSMAGDEALKQQEKLQALNRESMELLNVTEGKTIYVIGHRSPDSDTVCSAIVFARFLNQLGYPAEPRITMPVNNETAYILEQAGAETPEILLDASGEDIFLVDHSEYAQAAEGMIDAHIVGVIDHHGIGSVNVGNQVAYEARPIGSTATLIWLMYQNCGLPIDQQTAYILLGAVLSDTYNLTITSTTEVDRQAIPALAELAGVSDTEALYKTLHEKSISYDGMTPQEILFSDYKEYESGGTKYAIGIVNALDDENAKKMAEIMKEALPAGFETKDADLMYADIMIRENGQKIDYIVPANQISADTLIAAFPDYDECDGTSYIYRKGLGRKSVFVPGMTEYLNTHPHE